MNLEYDNENDMVLVDGLRFYGGKTDGDLASIFVNNEYERLVVNGRMVIDIGASIGDSCLLC